MERFIRQKYQQMSLANGASPERRPRAESLDYRDRDDSPPPPPPKHGSIFSRFGHRAVSSTLPLKKPKNERNKASRIFGNDIASRSPVIAESEESKLEKLREMGFDDEKTSRAILRGVSGDVDKAIEALIRLGDAHPGRRSTPRTRNPSPPPGEGFDWSPPQREVEPRRPQAGLSFHSAEPATQPTPPIQPVQPVQPAPPPRQLSATNPFAQFLAPPQTAPLQSDFPQMPAAQHLFPHSTGEAPRVFQQAPYQLPLTPPLPLNAQQQYQMYYPQSNVNGNPQMPMSAPLSSYNHFSSQAPQSYAQSQNPYQSYNPTPDQQIPRGPYSAPLQQQHVQTNQNPYHQSNMLTPQTTGFSYGSSPAYPSAQPLAPQRTGKFDKSVIMSFYNYPQLAPQRPLGSPASLYATAEDPADQLAELSMSPRTGSQGQRSVSSPVTSPMQTMSKNPFAQAMGSPLNSPGMTSAPISMASGQQAAPPPMRRQLTRDSMDVGGWQNGRHSPDAFASLSARLVR